MLVLLRLLDSPVFALTPLSCVNASSCVSFRSLSAFNSRVLSSCGLTVRSDTVVYEFRLCLLVTKNVGMSLLSRRKRVRKKKIASSAAGLCALALSSRGRTIYVTLQSIALIKVVARKYDLYVRQLKVTLKVTTHVPLAGSVA